MNNFNPLRRILLKYSNNDFIKEGSLWGKWIILRVLKKSLDEKNFAQSAHSFSSAKSSLIIQSSIDNKMYRVFYQENNE